MNTLLDPWTIGYVVMGIACLLVLGAMWKMIEDPYIDLSDELNKSEKVIGETPLEKIVREGLMLRIQMEQQGYRYVNGKLLTENKGRTEYTGWVMYQRLSDNHIRRFELYFTHWIEKSIGHEHIAKELGQFP